MKVLHLVGGTLNGGAARGAYWLHCAILDDPHVMYLTRSKKGKAFSLLRSALDSLPVRAYRGKQEYFSAGIFGFDFTKTKEYQEADVLHLHWVTRGLVNMRHLAKVKKPVVWTLRDMWPMTGGCHVPLDCERYKEQCGNCPMLGRRGTYDLSYWVLRRKIKSLPRSAVIVGMNASMSEAARASALFRACDIRTIPNNINTDDYSPIDKRTARAALGISTKKKIVLTGAHGSRAAYKGFDLFLNSLKHLSAQDLFLVFFGDIEDDSVRGLGFEYKNLGYLRDTLSLRLVYSAADVFIGPSRMEAFGKTIAEAMACGTPVVCFDATGPKDIVDHRQNGYKAIPFSAEDLAEGIIWVLQASDDHALARNARTKIVTMFDSRIVAEQYKALYQEILDSKHRLAGN
jgi:glycosyltransferase involved in cell wall biosynthesis